MTRKNANQKSARSLVHRSAATRGRYPFERRYAALQEDDEHPIDRRVDQIQEIAAVDRRIRRESSHWEKHVDNPARYRDYEDLWLRQRCLREEAFFDAGHEYGRLVGRTEAFGAVARRGRGAEIVRSILRAAESAKQPPVQSAALLLAVAHALLVDPRLASRTR